MTINSKSTQPQIQTSRDRYLSLGRVTLVPNVLQPQLQGTLLQPCLALSMLYYLIVITRLVFRIHPFRHLLYKNVLNSNPLERMIATGQEFRNLGCWSWMLLWGNNNVRTIIITAYQPKVSSSTGVAYIQQLEAFTIMKIKNDPRTQFWIDLNKEISKWIHQREQIIIIGDRNS